MKVIVSVKGLDEKSTVSDVETFFRDNVSNSDPEVAPLVWLPRHACQSTTVRFQLPKGTSLDAIVTLLEGRAMISDAGQSMITISKDFKGLTVLSELTHDAEFDLVFIHGLGGHGARTFSTPEKGSQQSTFWPRDLLPDICAKRQCFGRISTFGHDASKDWRGGAFVSSIEETAETLLNDIELSRPHGSNRPIVLVCHSLGGLIACQAMVYVMSQDEKHQRTRELYDKFNVNGECLIKGAIFFGTPFKGSRLANIFGPVLLRLGNEDAAFARLRVEDKKTKEMLLTFVNLRKKQTNPLPLTMFYETRLTKKFGMSFPVVTHDSARGYFTDSNVKREALNKDHSSLCRFGTATDEDFFDYVQPCLFDLFDKIRHNQAFQLPDHAALANGHSEPRQMEPLAQQLRRWSDGSLQPPMKRAEMPSAIFKYRQGSKTAQLSDSGAVDAQSIIEKLRLVKTSGRFGEVDTALPGTCDHILETSAYRDWHDQEASSILIVRGASGTGKSVLARYLVESLSKGEPFMTYFFCNSSEGLGAPALILRSLLHRIATKHPTELLEAARNVRMILGDRLTFEVYWDLFKRMLSDVSIKMFCIVDGLDECIRSRQAGTIATTKDDEVVNFLKALFRALLDNHKINRSQVKLLITTRPLPAISEATAKYDSCIMDLASLRLKANVALMIESDVMKLAKVHGLPSEIEQYIKEELTLKAGDSFQYARSALEFLQTAESASLGSLEGYQKALSNLNMEDMNSPYLENLKLIRARGGKDPRTVSIVSSLLTILVFAKHELSLRDLQHGLAFAVETAESVPFAQRIPYSLGRIIASICGSLLIVDGERVRFAHQSVKEFLLNLDPQMWPDFSCQNSRNCHLLLARICLRFIRAWAKTPSGESERRSTFAEDWKSTDDEMPFLEYALTYWDAHVAASAHKELRAEVLGMIGDSYVEMSRQRCRILTLRGGERAGYGQRFCGEIDPVEPVSVFLARTNLAELIMFDDGTRKKSIRKRLTKAWERLPTKEGFDLKATDSQGWGMLHFAAMNGNIDLVKRLTADGFHNNLETTDNETPFSIAIENDHEDIAMYFINARATSAPRRNNLRRSTLQMAVNWGMRKVLAHHDLLHWNLNEHDHFENMTPLYIACDEEHYEIFEWLLEKGVSPSLSSDKGYAPLHILASNGNLRIMKRLVHHLSSSGSFDLDPRTKRGRTPLHVAAYNGHLDTVKFLLDRECQQTQDENGWLPLHDAAVQGHHLIVQILGNASSNLTRDVGGLVPIHLAAFGGHSNVVNFFLEAGVNPNLRALWRRAPHHASHDEASCISVLSTALRSNDERTIRLLLNAADLQVSHRSAWYRSLLDEAIIFGSSPDICSELVSRGVNPMTPDKDGWTTLHLATSCGSLEVLAWLLDLLRMYDGFDIEGESRKGWTAAQCAAAYGTVEKFKLLQERGANVHKIDPSSGTPLTSAVRFGNLDVLQHMVEQDADYELDMFQETIMGETILHFGSQQSPDILNLCLSAGRDINHQNLLKETPLLYAVLAGASDACSILLSRGADPTSRDGTGMAVLDYVHSEHSLWDLFKVQQQTYEPLDEKSRKQATLESLRLFFSHQGVFCHIRDIPFSRYLNALARLLLRCEDSGDEVARTMELTLELLRSNETFSYIACCNCGKEYVEGSWHICSSCLFTVLCSTCAEEHRAKNMKIKNCAKSHTYIQYGGESWKSLRHGTVNEQGQTATEWLDTLKAKYAHDPGPVEVPHGSSMVNNCAEISKATS